METNENGVRSRSSSASSTSSSSSSYLSPHNDGTKINSPKVQVMERDDVEEGGGGGIKGYDPERIPSSVFDRSQSNVAADWSCTSNESLFSIHLGRNDLMKSGELYKSGELLAYSPGLPMPPIPGSEPKHVEQEPYEVTIDDDDDDDSEKVLLVVEKETYKEQEQHPAVSWKTPTTNSYRSTPSSNSTHSFSFPILAGAASESSKAETEERKKRVTEAQEKQEKLEESVSNQKQSSSMMWRWLSCFPPCPWCCSSSRSPCTCA